MMKALSRFILIAEYEEGSIFPLFTDRWESDGSYLESILQGMLQMQSDISHMLISGSS